MVTLNPFWFPAKIYYMSMIWDSFMHEPGRDHSPRKILCFFHLFQIPFVSPCAKFLDLEADGGRKKGCGHVNSASC